MGSLKGLRSIKSQRINTKKNMKLKKLVRNNKRKFTQPIKKRKEIGIGKMFYFYKD